MKGGVFTKSLEKTEARDSQGLVEAGRRVENSFKRLAQAFELLQSALAVIPGVLIACDDRHCIETVNGQSAGMLGYEKEELLGAHITELLPNSPSAIMLEPSFTLSGVELRKSDGSIIETDVRGQTVEAQGRRFLALSIQDSAARKAADKIKSEISGQLHECRRLEAIGALAGGIAHELNTPMQFIGDNIAYVENELNSIRLACVLCHEARGKCTAKDIFSCTLNKLYTSARDIDLPRLIDDLCTAIRETREGINHVRTIVSLVKEFSHPGTGAAEDVDINAVIKRALAICRFRCRALATVTTALMEPTPPVKCQPSQIQQVLTNIIINAVEAIEEQGRHDGCIEIATHVVAGHLRIELSDTGPGIPEAIRAHIFDPFFTTKRPGKGTGQGLALARDMIESKHKGRLYLGEKRGFATTFVIELPLDLAAMKDRGMAGYVHT